MARGFVTVAGKASEDLQTAASNLITRTAPSESLELLDDVVGILLQPLEERGEEFGAVQQVEGNIGTVHWGVSAGAGKRSISQTYLDSSLIIFR